jgi:hypothetical protein
MMTPVVESSHFFVFFWSAEARCWLQLDDCFHFAWAAILSRNVYPVLSCRLFTVHSSSRSSTINVHSLSISISIPAPIALDAHPPPHTPFSFPSMLPRLSAL